MKKKNVLITATGGRSVGSGILHALTRSSDAVNERWNVIAADADAFAWGLYKVNESVLLPLAGASNYLDAVKKTIDKFKIDAIIPGSEAEAQVLSVSVNELGIPVIGNKPSLIPLMMDKFAMVEKLKSLNLPFIETYRIENWQEAFAKHKFPFVVKPTTGTGGSRGLHFVFDERELKMLLPSLATQSNYCIQPYIGSGDDEYTIGILSDKAGSVIDSIVMKRKLTGLSLLNAKKINAINYAISTGYSQGFIIKDAILQGFCENVATLIGSTGPLNIQLRKYEDKYYIFEIHPRFSGTTPIRADVGFNEPDILLRNNLNDETFGRLDYKFNVAAIRALEHVIVPMDKLL